jgi:hypothetical protein
VKTVNLFIPGIRTIPGESKNWCGRAVTYTHINAWPHVVAEKIEYFTTILLRPFGQAHRAEKLVRTAEFYNGTWTRNIIVHSNGADVALDALRADPGLTCDKLHLICAACDADFDRNGLNSLLVNGRVQTVFIYIAGRDAALKFAANWFARTLLGYGTLGLHGPVKVRPEIETRVKVIRRGWETFGHSDCWSEENFAATMANFL